MSTTEIRFGIIGCGLMGREFASAVARWSHLLNINVKPRIVAVCDTNEDAMRWFQRAIPDLDLVTNDYRELVQFDGVDAVYCAVPHNLHEEMYTAAIEAGKHLLGEKPFGIDARANAAIMGCIHQHPEVLVRCASEFPYFPGAYRLMEWLVDGSMGQIIDVEAGFWHSSDLDPQKPINWKRIVKMNGEYGCMGDLGMHVLHVPLRLGWIPATVRALLSKIVKERPDASGAMVPCETWDNAILACHVDSPDGPFPMTLSMKRIAPGHTNTWFLRVNGTKLSAEFSTKYPKQLRYMPYRSGQPQAWRVLDLEHKSAYPVITGGIFEFGFTDAILQMWAAFCDEIVNGDTMSQPFHCVTPDEATISHSVFSAALRSWANHSVESIDTPQHKAGRTAS